ncbi:cytochrome c1 [Sphingomonas prati]|uniref:Cytochrome c1 n=1 Tax=Sphingomonas prati TaxID=1843237 RepID=A0A7W9BPD0_9SPHN|nr:cytochrome c1 [Sphingomonas prati]MBB5727555.1 ubiquinol-cytochrome c reductase cytochrome c1 subunit [Sphingomonas prati]GGE78848.1 ribosomal protein P2 [Sphingomonas prati]
MVRIIAFLAGLVFVMALVVAMLIPRQPAVENTAHHFHVEPQEVAFASDGAFGRFDRQQLQRGFQVYKEVCAACHSLRHVAFRDLTELGFTAPEVKAIAKNWAIEVPSVNPDTGEPATRKAIPSDMFPSPYANEVAARAANNNALPPDLSLMTKAREGHAEYVHGLLTGYRKAPADLPAEARPGPGLYYNPVYANLNIAMPPPLVAEGQVSYADGTKPTVDQMAQDVSAFLIWTAEPKLENRKRTGVAVILFLLLATTLAYFAYQNIWADKKAKPLPQA